MTTHQPRHRARTWLGLALWLTLAVAIGFATVAVLATQPAEQVTDDPMRQHTVTGRADQW